MLVDVDVRLLPRTPHSLEMYLQTSVTMNSWHQYHDNTELVLLLCYKT